MKVIYFVRHGECEANAEGRIAGSRNDSPLTEEGLKQADATAESLRGKQIDLIITSPLKRARVTAERIAHKIGYEDKIIVEPLLAERDFGSATGHSTSTGFAAVDAGEIDDLETLDELADRMSRVLKLFESLPGRYILVVGHSGAERMMHTIYDGKSYKTFLDTEVLHYCEVREYKLGV